jgi:hypothetical protein
MTSSLGAFTFGSGAEGEKSALGAFNSKHLSLDQSKRIAIGGFNCADGKFSKGVKSSSIIFTTMKNSNNKGFLGHSNLKSYKRALIDGEMTSYDDSGDDYDRKIKNISKNDENRIKNDKIRYCTNCNDPLTERNENINGHESIDENREMVNCDVDAFEMETRQSRCDGLVSSSPCVAMRRDGTSCSRGINPESTWYPRDYINGLKVPQRRGYHLDVTDDDKGKIIKFTDIPDIRDKIEKGRTGCSVNLLGTDHSDLKTYGMIVINDNKYINNDVNFYLSSDMGRDCHMVKSN